MKILVFSDSHSYKNLMNRCIDAVKPDAVIHLGDHYDDTDELVRKYFDIPFHQVRGNCDSGSAPLNAPAVLCYAVGGVRFYMTHGHLHNVKKEQLDEEYIGIKLFLTSCDYLGFRPLCIE